MNDLNLGKQLWDFKDVDSLIEEFLEIYSKRPIENNWWGCHLHIYFGHGMC